MVIRVDVDSRNYKKIFNYYDIISVCFIYFLVFIINVSVF